MSFNAAAAQDHKVCHALTLRRFPIFKMLLVALGIRAAEPAFRLARTRSGEGCERCGQQQKCTSRARTHEDGKDERRLDGNTGPGGLASRSAALFWFFISCFLFLVPIFGFQQKAVSDFCHVGAMNGN